MILKMFFDSRSQLKEVVQQRYISHIQTVVTTKLRFLFHSIKLFKNVVQLKLTQLRRVYGGSIWLLLLLILAKLFLSSVGGVGNLGLA